MKELVEKEKAVFETITDIYIFLLILIFPLIIDKTGFFHIFECKWYSYLIIACTYVGTCILTFLYFLIFKKINYFRHLKLTIIQWLAIVFLIINIISCFTSPFYEKYNLFIGIGRGEGLIMTSLYVLSFLLITWFAKFKKKYIMYFIVLSILLNIIAFLQYIGFNPFYIYKTGGLHNVSFMTTIGNVDFISALYCILLAISFSSFVFLNDNKKWEQVLQILSVFLGFFIIGVIDVQSGKVAFIGTLIIILPFIISDNRRLSRFLVMFSTILMSYCINIIINPEYHYDIQKLGLYFQFNYMVIIFIIVCAVLYFLAYVLKNTKYSFTKNIKKIKQLYFLIFIFILLGITVIYFYNFKSGIFYEMHELLHGNYDDTFGTYRIFLWKRTIPLISEFPIFGSGPDTFAVRFMAKYTQDILAIGPLTINDTAANVYLTMTINIGIFGALTYLAFIFFNLKNGIKNGNKYSFVLLTAVICFLIQDLFNLWQVIVTPIFWLLLGLHYKSIFCKN